MSGMGDGEAWWKVDMNEQYTVIKFAIVGWITGHVPSEFSLQGSNDDSTWTTVYTSNEACYDQGSILTGWHKGGVGSCDAWSDIEKQEEQWSTVTSPNVYRFYRVLGNGWGPPCNNGYCIMCNVLFYGWKGE